MSILTDVADAMDRMEDEGRKPARLLIGHREAGELDVALRPYLRPRPPDDEPILPYPLTQTVTIFGVRVERVDQPSLLGVIAEGY